MERISSSPPFPSSDLEVSPSFNIVIAYEDFVTGKRAKKTYDYLVANLGHDCEFCNQMWKFEVLGISKLREMAAKDAVMADVIIISAHGDTDLPAEVKAWIESWLAQKTNAIALVAQFDSPHENPLLRAAACNYLDNVARRADMEFFAEPEGLAARSTEEHLFGLKRSVHIDAPAMATLSAKMEHDLSFPRWGINE